MTTATSCDAEGGGLGRAEGVKDQKYGTASVSYDWQSVYSHDKNGFCGELSNVLGDIHILIHFAIFLINNTMNRDIA